MRRTGPLLVASFFIASICVVGCGHGTADPNGAVLQEVRTVLRAVPPSAGALQTSAADARWLPGCGDGTGHAGWSSVYVTARFSSEDPKASVLAAINGLLVSHGWQRHDIVATPGQGPIPHWTRMVTGRGHANAFAYQVPAGSNAWYITGSWQPSPEVDNGDCA
jgi:hypothetical protein